MSRKYYIYYILEDNIFIINNKSTQKGVQWISTLPSNL